MPATDAAPEISNAVTALSTSTTVKPTRRTLSSFAASLRDGSPSTLLFNVTRIVYPPAGSGGSSVVKSMNSSPETESIAAWPQTMRTPSALRSSTRLVTAPAIDFPFASLNAHFRYSESVVENVVEPEVAVLFVPIKRFEAHPFTYSHVSSSVKTRSTVSACLAYERRYVPAEPPESARRTFR